MSQSKLGCLVREKLKLLLDREMMGVNYMYLLHDTLIEIKRIPPPRKRVRLVNCESSSK